MAKAEISWRRRTETGERLDVYAQHVGDQWRFYARERRYDQWQAVAKPPLEDWQELLDAVRRRINRRLLASGGGGAREADVLETLPPTRNRIRGFYQRAGSISSPVKAKTLSALVQSPTLPGWERLCPGD